nr:monofunctional biosynthetic peptidoglycan transglycosylase [Cochlodiniinecator piscidefendens]
MRKWLLRGGLGVVVFIATFVLLFSVVNPPTNHTIWSEGQRLGQVDQQWIPIEEMSPHVALSAIASEDVNFCNHWGFDMTAIRAALAEGSRRGASTITQQTVKNVYLWQGRSWVRKALEAVLTPMVELVWSKQRILEVYLNIAEFDEGVFGIEAASHHYFRISPSELSARQAALLIALLPNPKVRSASSPSSATSSRATSIMDGAATIRRDDRSACFES